MSTQHLGPGLRNGALSHGRLLRCETGLINTYLLTESKYKKIRESAARRGASVSVRSRTLSLHLIPSFALTRPETTATRPTSLSHSCRIFSGQKSSERQSWKEARRCGAFYFYINACLSNLPMHAMAVRLLGAGVHQTFNKHRSRFFWEANNSKHKYQWVR
jgi:hypothetical protein